MKYKLLILLGVVATSCQTSKSNLKSNWSVLQEAKSIDCQKWPFAPGDLEVLKIQEAELRSGRGFVVSSRDRMGRRVHSYRSFNKGEVSEDEFIRLNWGQNSEYLGDILLDGDRFFVIQRESRTGQQLIEVRDPIKNIVKYSSLNLGRNLRGQYIRSHESGFWLIYKDLKAGESIEDLPSKILRFSFGKGERLSHQRVKFEIGNDHYSSTVNSNEIFIMWKERQKKKGTEGFKYAIVGDGKKKISVYNFETAKERVESWTLAPHRDGFLMVFVVGDTLIWENASMEIRILDQRGEVFWTQSTPIENKHIGDPLIVAKPTYSFLMVPKWLDGESTLEVHKVVENDLSHIGDFGVYKEGTYLVKGMGRPKSENPFILKQYPSGFTKKFSICEIEI